ncbi:MAG: metallophosphoesterase, partial [Candidatus Hydrogenedentes bacterium]|nr:metallophosphoesterase [Candidatus Hydrogenedentota bacterium]
GNHDDQDGLGPGMYLDQFALPGTGFNGLPAERAYALRYANALFLVLPIGEPTETVVRWIEKELASTDATWKFAIYHFPIYTDDPEYAHYYDKQRAIWGAAFDAYHLDAVLMGHTHKYYRSKPIRAGVEAASFADGTVYLVSAPNVYNRFAISGRRLEFESVDTDGVVKDSFVIEK